jgi:hypothetical protein
MADLQSKEQERLMRERAPAAERFRVLTASVAYSARVTFASRLVGSEH